MMLQEMLTRIGYIVVGVLHSGEEAVEKAGAVHPDVILMDIHLLGEMDGITAAEHICAEHDIAIIYLTAYADDATIERAVRTESQSYLVKPINMKELFANIELAIYKRRKRQNTLPPGVPEEECPSCPDCETPMVRTFMQSRQPGRPRQMAPVGWICPKCRHFEG